MQWNPLDSLWHLHAIQPCHKVWLLYYSSLLQTAWKRKLLWVDVDYQDTSPWHRRNWIPFTIENKNSIQAPNSAPRFLRSKRLTWEKPFWYQHTLYHCSMLRIVHFWNRSDTSPNSSQYLISIRYSKDDIHRQQNHIELQNSLIRLPLFTASMDARPSISPMKTSQGTGPTVSLLYIY